MEASLFDCGLSLLHPHAANWFLDGKNPGLTGNAHPNIYPYDAFPTRSVPVFLAVGNDRQFGLLCKHLQTEALAHGRGFLIRHPPVPLGVVPIPVWPHTPREYP